MTRDEMREEYERRFPKPTETLWNNLDSRYTWSDGYDPQIVEIARQYQYGWEVWQAARAGGEVENEREIMTLILERDHWEEKATELAERVGDFFGFEVGEHTSANCPVENAIHANWPAPVAKVPDMLDKNKLISELKDRPDRERVNFATAELCGALLDEIESGIYDLSTTTPQPPEGEQ